VKELVNALLQSYTIGHIQEDFHNNQYTIEEIVDAIVIVMVDKRNLKQAQERARDEAIKIIKEAKA
jgi:hypothetical protein